MTQEEVIGEAIATVVNAATAPLRARLRALEAERVTLESRLAALEAASKAKE